MPRSLASDGREGGYRTGEALVVARLSGEAGKVHGEEGSVGRDKGDPEVELAQSLIHQATGHQGKPVIDAGENREDSSHGHHEVKVRDYEERVVQIGIERRLGQDRAR